MGDVHLEAYKVTEQTMDDHPPLAKLLEMMEVIKEWDLPDLTERLTRTEEERDVLEERLDRAEQQLRQADYNIHLQDRAHENLCDYTKKLATQVRSQSVKIANLTAAQERSNARARAARTTEQQDRERAERAMRRHA